MVVSSVDLGHGRAPLYRPESLLDQSGQPGRIINETVHMGAYGTPLTAYLPLVLRGVP